MQPISEGIIFPINYQKHDENSFLPYLIKNRISNILHCLQISQVPQLDFLILMEQKHRLIHQISSWEWEHLICILNTKR
uniref:Uncharacterized protein n=1 Tax=Arundo donax TaxID=35708 RepID=A0A0A9G2R3_ARUDO